MPTSIVFIIDQQLNILEGAEDLQSIFPHQKDSSHRVLTEYFTPDKISDIEHVISERSVTSNRVGGSITYLTQNPTAELHLHCVDNSENPSFECILIYNNAVAETPSEVSCSLFKHNPLPFYCFDNKGRFIHVNQKLIDFTGLSEEQLLTLGFEDFVHSDDLERAQTQFDLALEGIPTQYEISVLIKDGVQKRIQINKFPRTEKGIITGAYGIFEDITDEYESEARWRELVEQSPLPVFVFIDAKIVFTNSAALPFYGFDSLDELIGRSVYEFIPDDEVEFLKDRQHRLENSEYIEPGESRIISRTGEVHHIIAHSRPIIYQGQQAIQSVIFDITKLKEQREVIEKSLKEKETLLKEIHHRVKNNLAIVSGLLELQMKKVDDSNTIDVLKDSQNRILSIALVHQKLYQVETLDEVNVGNYVEDLIESLKNSFQHSGNHNINVHAQDVFLDIEQAVPCSLIINEVVVNAIKHGFDESEPGNIDIYINRNPSMIQIKVEDNGKGIPEDFDLEHADSLGITLIKILSHQLEGNYLFDTLPDGGTRFILRFPITQH